MIEWLVEHPVLATAALTALFEAVTCWGRFVHGVEAARDTCALAALTRGLRIHHCYVGGLMLAVSLVVPGSAGSLLACVGAALVVSDLVHHFAVLWPVTGAHAFDLKYPARDH